MCIQCIAKSEKQNNKICFSEGFKQNYVTATDKMVITFQMLPKRNWTLE